MTIYDVGEHDADVVGPATAQSEFDEAVGAFARVGEGAERLGEGLLGEPVGILTTGDAASFRDTGELKFLAILDDEPDIRRLLAAALEDFAVPVG